jgi:hypothetical protein
VHGWIVEYPGEGTYGFINFDTPWVPKVDPDTVLERVRGREDRAGRDADAVANREPVQGHRVDRIWQLQP